MYSYLASLSDNLLVLHINLFQQQNINNSSDSTYAKTIEELSE